MLDEFRSTLITWDKATSRIYSPITANASDENGRKLVVQIVNSGQVEDLTGATLHLYWETRDKAHDGLDAFKAVDLKKGEFELSYTTGMLSNQGVLNANLVLIDTVGRVVSDRFKITVTEGIDNDAIQSENSFTSLTQALIDISNLETNYTPRLNDLTAQLQQTETISNKRFETSTYKITDDNTYTAWPQDKCFEMNGVLYALFNQGVAHNSTGLQPMMKVSRDGGISWSSNKVIRSSPSKVTYPRGVTCWGAGTDGTNFYAVILYRGSSTTVGASKHTLIYGDPDDKAKNWTEIEINISKDGHVPNQYHSFVKLPDGSIAFGYNYLSGEVGIAKTFDKGVTWETHVIYTDAQMQNKLNLCEVTLTYDSVNNAVVGFMRAENKILDTPKFFISRDNCQTFEKHETNILVDQTPFPITMVGNKYYAFYSERYGKAKAYLLEGVASEVLTQGFSAFKQTFLGFLNNYKSPSGTGVGSVVSFDGNLHIFYSAENKNSTVDVYQTIVNLKQDDEAILSSPIASAKIDDGQKTEIVLYNNVAQTIPATTATKLSYSQIGQDELLEYNPTDSSITVKNKGIYMFEISVDLGTLTNAQSYLEVRINGSNAKRLAWVNTYNTASITVLQGTYFQKMNAGTKIEFYVLTSNQTTTRVGQPNNYLLAYQI